MLTLGLVVRSSESKALAMDGTVVIKTQGACAMGQIALSCGVWLTFEH